MVSGETSLAFSIILLIQSLLAESWLEFNLGDNIVDDQWSNLRSLPNQEETKNKKMADDQLQ